MFGIPHPFDPLVCAVFSDLRRHIVGSWFFASLGRANVRFFGLVSPKICTLFSFPGVSNWIFESKKCESKSQKFSISDLVKKQNSALGTAALGRLLKPKPSSAPGLILVAKTVSAFYDLRLQLASGQMKREPTLWIEIGDRWDVGHLTCLETWDSLRSHHDYYDPISCFTYFCCPFKKMRPLAAKLAVCWSMFFGTTRNDQLMLLHQKFCF